MPRDRKIGEVVECVVDKMVTGTRKRDNTPFGALQVYHGNQTILLWPDQVLTMEHFLGRGHEQGDEVTLLTVGETSGGFARYSVIEAQKRPANDPF